MTPPTPQQLAKLPKWAQEHVTRLRRRLERTEAAWKRQGGLQNVRVRHRGRELTITADAPLNLPPRQPKFPQGYRLLEIRYAPASASDSFKSYDSKRLCDAIWGREKTRKVLVLIEDRK